MGRGVIGLSTSYCIFSKTYNIKLVSNIILFP
nr:MAG TPA: hypothetical protein [Caudoviricetes sp.]